jgi:hypothetical protein
MANVYVEPAPKAALMAAQSRTMSSRTMHTMFPALSKSSTKRSTGRKIRAVLRVSLKKLSRWMTDDRPSCWPPSVLSRLRLCSSA